MGSLPWASVGSSEHFHSRGSSKHEADGASVPKMTHQP